MARSKLDKILQLRQLKENESAGALARTRRARQAAEDKARELHEITGQYRDSHQQQPAFDPYMLKQFREFYGQLARAAQAQAVEVERAVQAEKVVMNHYISHHADRKALENLLEQRDLAHKNEEKRKARRAEPTRRKGPLSTLV